MAFELTEISSLPDAHVQRWSRSANSGEQLALGFRLPRYWQKHAAEDRLVAVYELQANGAIHFIVCEAEAYATQVDAETKALPALAGQMASEVFGTDRTLALQPVHIPKPWGEEIWYTGMEDRGVALAGHADRAIPLPWVLSALPSALCSHRERDLMLLKILAPKPQEVFGDLYFELHEKKREVYVVTAVDSSAWPDGVGAIRFGFDAGRRQAFSSDEAFRSAFLQAVKDYEKVRREIDALLDKRAGDDVAARELLMAQLPEQLIAREEELRASMNAFTALMPLQPGDVVKVPTHTPHALQHGVRTIEFQTPVYERLIVAFAQKVLTQPHWDTDAAIAKMQLDTPEQPPSECLLDDGGVRVERIVDFADFEVHRYVVQPGSAFELPSPDQYSVIIVIQGVLPLAECGLGPEQALLVPNTHPAMSLHYQAEALAGQTLIFLVGYPAPPVDEKRTG